MISATVSVDDPHVKFIATISGVAVYLDTWAIINLAKQDPSRRTRFVSAIRAGGDLLFSSANAAELAGPEGNSFEAVRAFLDQLEDHWVPIELNPFKVIEREKQGVRPSESSISADFMTAYFRNRTVGYSPGSGKVIDLSHDFFRLGVVMDWVAQSDKIRKNSPKMDNELMTAIYETRAKYEQNPSLLQNKFSTFNPAMPTSFTCFNLLRTLVIESKAYQVKKGDGLDFCHAVMGSAFASVATLDKQWKRRVDNLPQPNELARIYSPLELDKMVTDLESHIKRCGIL
jgi:hypothetical protein